MNDIPVFQLNASGIRDRFARIERTQDGLNAKLEKAEHQLDLVKGGMVFVLLAFVFTAAWCHTQNRELQMARLQVRVVEARYEELEKAMVYQDTEIRDTLIRQMQDLQHLRQTFLGWVDDKEKDKP